MDYYIYAILWNSCRWIFRKSFYRV